MGGGSRTATAIRFDPAVYDRLAVEAERLGLSMNQIVNRAVEKYVDELAAIERLMP